LDPAAVSELVVRVVQWWEPTWWSGSSGGGHAPSGQGLLVVGMSDQGLAPSFYTFWVPVSQLQWAWGESLGGLIFRPQRQVFNFLAYVT